MCVAYKLVRLICELIYLPFILKHFTMFLFDAIDLKIKKKLVGVSYIQVRSIDQNLRYFISTNQ